MTGRGRCDEIVRLVDDALVDPATSLPSAEPARVSARRPAPLGATQMTSIELVRLLVREWAEKWAPDDPAVVDRAVRVAQRSYASGASVGDACWLARRYVECWNEHPANRRYPRRAVGAKRLNLEPGVSVRRRTAS
jgi:hypothetical protein